MTLKHKTQSSDLALSDYQLFPGLKKNLPVTMKLNSEMETGTTGGLITEETVFCQQGTDKHISRYSKYVSRDGE